MHSEPIQKEVFSVILCVWMVGAISKCVAAQGGGKGAGEGGGVVREAVQQEYESACLPSCGEENEIFQCSISVANSITVGTCSKRCNFQEAEIENLAANETANH